MTADIIHGLQEQTRAAHALREALAKVPDVDEETTRDTIEGETGLHEAITAAFEMLTDTEAMIEGLEAKQEQFAARLKRHKDRAGFIRAAIEQAMTIGGLKKLELPDATLSLDRRAAGIVITDEAQIPAKFWKPQDPELDKKALAAALKDKEEVPGAALGNGGVSLTVRRA